MNSIYEELRAALYSVWHRRWLALAVAWGVCLIGWLLVAMVPNSYESRARLFVQLDDVLAEQIGVGGTNKSKIDRVRQTLTSAVNLEKVIRGTAIGDNIATPKEMEQEVLSLGKEISVTSEQDNLFTITARYGDGSNSDATNAKIAQDVVQKMIDMFREENLSGNRGQMSQSLEFLDQQLTARQKELEAAEQKRLAFEAANPGAVEGGAGVLQRLESNRAELRGIDADLAAAQSALAAINGQLAGTPRTIASSVTGRTPLGDAQAQLNALRARGLTENHPDVIAARNMIATMRAQGGDTAAGSVPNPAYSSLESIRAERQANVQSLTARRAALSAEVSRITAEQISNPTVAAEQQRINRDYDVLKEQYDKLLQDREQLRLRGQVETEHSAVQFQVIDPPTTPRSPVAPNRPLLLVGVLLAGIASGAAAAFAIGQLRSTFATTAKLERTMDLPVLGAITSTLTEQGRALRKKRMRYFYAVSAALFGVFILLMVIEFVQRRMVG